MLRTVSLIGALVLLPAAASAQQPCTTDARLVVSEVYSKVLERAYDNGGASLVNRLNRGQISVKDVISEVAKSREHTQRFLSGDREAAVQALYKHILGRQADPDGVKAHVAGANTHGFPAVIDAMLASDEYRNNVGDHGIPGSSLRYCGASQTSSARDNRMRFSGMDRNNDGRITSQEWNGTRESFVVHDWNGDDVLSGEEVRVGGRRALRRGADDDFNPAAPGRLNSWTEATFTNLDRNRDGRISANEWYYDTESFVRADRNRDGILARGEFLGSDNMDDDRDDRFENLDANRNSRIERNEWHASADAFDWLDRNNDNVLSRTEVLGTNQTAADQFATLDSNRDGRLTVAEWPWSRRSFNQQDGDNDGALTRREFTSGGAVPTTGR
jgi:Ca2+-binding EF-hand superfamily protein